MLKAFRWEKQTEMMPNTLQLHLSRAADPDLVKQDPNMDLKTCMYNRVAPDIWPAGYQAFLYPVSGRISGFVCRISGRISGFVLRISGWPDIRPEKLNMVYPFFNT